MQQPEKNFYSGIDTWRGLAALMVCVFHFSLYQNVHGSLFNDGHTIKEIGRYGYLGVYIFFVISGFVIPLSMFNGQYRYGKLGKFIAKRSLRIEPPYIATILVIFVMGFYFARKWGLEYSIDPIQFVSHIFYAVPFVKGMEWHNSIFWTLAIEFQFYLLCALVFPLWVHKNRLVRHLSLLVFFCSAYFVTDNRLVFFYASIFGFGIALSLLRMKLINKFELLLYALLCGTLLMFGNTREIFLATVFAFVLLLLPDFNLKPGTWLGKISYSLYLTHGLSGSTFLMLCFSQIAVAPEILFMVALLISIVFAGIFYFIVEKPFQSLSRKIKL